MDVVTLTVASRFHKENIDKLPSISSIFSVVKNSHHMVPYSVIIERGKYW